jgi:hypothetical protein
VSSSKFCDRAGSACNSGTGRGGGTGVRPCGAGAAVRGGGGAAGSAGGAGSATVIVLAMRAISASKGERGLPCTAEDTNRDITSKAADIEAAAVCARSIEGNALVGLLLAQAATTSDTA